MVGTVKVFALFDRKAREFGAPLTAANVDTMKRELQRNVGEGSLLHKYPEDFDLYCLGEMDTETGVILPDTPQCVALLKEVLDGSSAG